MEEIPKETIKAYALENAIKYAGKANQGAVLASLFAEGLEKDQVKNYIPLIQEVIKEVGALSLEEQKTEFENIGKETRKRDIRIGLPPLPGAIDGKVITRFAPFPSGPLHIGNARTLILNDEYTKIHNGKLLLVMDDTIGSEQKPIEPEAYKMIEEGVKYLGVKYDPKIIYKSSRIEKYYQYAEELIKKGYIYICHCNSEKRRQNKIDKIECACRQYHGENQLKRWKKMFSAEEGSMCARLKTSMSDPDPAFRDRVMFRISERPHAKLGRKYRIYPLLDFSWAIDDHIFGITHIIRGMELAIETRVEKFIWDIFEWKHPEVIYNGHFEIEGVKISKSKGAEEVRNGSFNGWNDPRTWSLQSLQDRGITPEAIREFIINMGIRKTNITVPLGSLYSLNRKQLGKVPRYFFIESPGKIKIKMAPVLDKEIPHHQVEESLGKRKFKTNQDFIIPEVDLELMEDKDYNLTNLFSFTSSNIIRTKPRDFHFKATLPREDKRLKTIEWLPDNNENIKVIVIMPEGEETKGLGEPSLQNLKEGSLIYFENFGYAKLNKKEKERLTFFFAHT